MRKTNLKASLCLLAFTLMSTSVQAKMFKNAYITFEMKDNWNCMLEKTEWVCRADKSTPESKEAVIIITAKEKGASDSFESYKAHLDNTIRTSMKTGSALTSVVKYKSEYKKINNQTWLDSLHQDSEIKNYFTRYIATVNDQLAVLITFSAHNSAYSKYSADFDKAVQSLRIIADTKKMFTDDSMGMKEFNGQDGNGLINMIQGEGEGTNKNGGGFMKNPVVLGGALIILAILLYIIYRLYSKKNQ